MPLSVQPSDRPRPAPPATLAPFHDFTWNGRQSRRGLLEVDASDGPVRIDTLTNEFWTSRQRLAHSLHEVSYRACFKPQLPGFFIDRLTTPGQVVYDPFMGRGTTVLEAALRERLAIGCDVNPLSRMLTAPRLRPSTLDDVGQRLTSIDLGTPVQCPPDLLTFYHPDTLQEICALRAYLLQRETDGQLDDVDQWIRMVAVNRLTGHSSGFFSVYTLPPNQALSLAAQRRINERRRQTPPRREVPALILAKTRSLLRRCTAAHREVLARHAARHRLLTAPSAATPDLPPDSVDLVVTSPPFLDVVDYAGDNWLRTWFCGIDPASVALTVVRRLDAWQREMAAVFAELTRVLRPGGHIAFEVGEVRQGHVKLEEAVLPCGVEAGLIPRLVLINTQSFTKTANCWGVTNNRAGTNTNRIVLFQKPAASSLPGRADRWLKAAPARRRSAARG